MPKLNIGIQILTSFIIFLNTQLVSLVFATWSLLLQELYIYVPMEKAEKRKEEKREEYLISEFVCDI